MRVLHSASAPTCYKWCLFRATLQGGAAMPRSIAVNLLLFLCVGLTVAPPCLATRSYSWTWQAIVDRADTVCMVRVEQVSEYAVWCTVAEEIKGCIKGQRLVIKLETSSKTNIPEVLPADKALIAGFRAPHPVLFERANLRVPSLEEPLKWREWDYDLVVPYDVAWEGGEGWEKGDVGWHTSSWGSPAAALKDLRAFVQSEPARRELEVLRAFAIDAIHVLTAQHPDYDAWCAASQRPDSLYDYLKWCVSLSEATFEDRDCRLAAEGVIESLKWGGPHFLKLINDECVREAWLQSAQGKQMAAAVLRLNYPSLVLRNPDLPRQHVEGNLENVISKVNAEEMASTDLATIDYVASVDAQRAITWLMEARIFGGQLSGCEAAYLVASLIVHRAAQSSRRRELLNILCQHENNMIRVVAATTVLYDDNSKGTAVLQAAMGERCRTTAALAALTLARWGRKECVEVCLEQLTKWPEGQKYTWLTELVRQRLVLLLANSVRNVKLGLPFEREFLFGEPEMRERLATWWKSARYSAIVGDPLLFLLTKPAQ